MIAFEFPGVVANAMTGVVLVLGQRVGRSIAGNGINPSIKNMTAYETAQSLASIAQQVLIKNLKPTAPANATNANVQIEKYVDQLKNAISKKAPFMNVMELVHVKLHPTMIAAYNLSLGH